jgi:hypothetical protein
LDPGAGKIVHHACICVKHNRCWEVRWRDVGGGERQPGASMRKMLITLPLRTSRMGYVSPRYNLNLSICFILSDNPFTICC